MATSTIQLETIQGLTYAIDLAIFCLFLYLVIRLFYAGKKKK